MGWKKQYDHLKPYKKAICNDPVGMLHPGWRMIIDENETQYLIQFKSGAAHWYSKNRFWKETLIEKPKPKVEEKIEEPTNFKKLF